MIRHLPALNALLNTTSALLLVAGYRSIRRGDRARHRTCMISALIVSVFFLASYLVYHAAVGTTRFAGQGPIRAIYFTILASHTILAALVPFLAVIALVLALRSRFAAHRRIARFALPVWLYVSVTGVVIYFMLYHL